jgi:hypothetical protein
MTISSRLSASETAERRLRRWQWTGAYLGYGVYCLTMAMVATPQTVHLAFMIAMAGLVALVLWAPLDWRASRGAGGFGHDLIRRASVLPLFALIARFSIETGALARYLPGAQ